MWERDLFLAMGLVILAKFRRGGTLHPGASSTVDNAGQSATEQDKRP
jgi:hypothetical protein